MAAPVDNFRLLQTYFSNIGSYAKMDGVQGTRVVYPLIGMLVVIHNHKKQLEVLEGGGTFSAVLWFYKGEDRYALSFNAKSGEFEIRKGNALGKPLHAFSNLTPLDELINSLEHLQ